MRELRYIDTVPLEIPGGSVASIDQPVFPDDFDISLWKMLETLPVNEKMVAVNLHIFKEIDTFESGHFQKLPQRVAAFQICIPIHTMTWKLEDITILQSTSYNLHHLIQFFHPATNLTGFTTEARDNCNTEAKLQSWAALRSNISNGPIMVPKKWWNFMRKDWLMIRIFMILILRMWTRRILSATCTLGTDSIREYFHVFHNILYRTYLQVWGNGLRRADFPRCLVQAVGESLELLEAIVHAADISNPCKSQTHSLDTCWQINGSGKIWRYLGQTSLCEFLRPKPMMLYWTQRAPCRKELPAFVFSIHIKQVNDFERLYKES